jgi:hypothetical protein
MKNITCINNISVAQQKGGKNKWRDISERIQEFI